MSVGEKLLILGTAIAVAAVLTATIWVAVKNIRARRRANHTNNAINRLK